MTPVRFFYLLMIAFQAESLIQWDTDWEYLLTNGYITQGTSSIAQPYVITTLGQTFLMDRFSKLLGL